MSLQYTPRTAPMSVYLMRIIGTDYYKIGISRNVPSRLVNIQVSIPFDVVLIRSVEHKEAARVEQNIHDALHDARVRGEWFLCAYEEVCRVFDAHIVNEVKAVLPNPSSPRKPRKKPAKGTHWMQRLPEGIHQITPAMVAEARDLSENRGWTQGHIAETLGISRKTVNDIIRRKGRFS